MADEKRWGVWREPTQDGWSVTPRPVWYVAHTSLVEAKSWLVDCNRADDAMYWIATIREYLPDGKPGEVWREDTTMHGRLAEAMRQELVSYKASVDRMLATQFVRPNTRDVYIQYIPWWAHWRVVHACLTALERSADVRRRCQGRGVVAPR